MRRDSLTFTSMVRAWLSREIVGAMCPVFKVLSPGMSVEAFGIPRVQLQNFYELLYLLQRSRLTAGPANLPTLVARSPHRGNRGGKGSGLGGGGKMYG